MYQLNVSLEIGQNTPDGHPFMGWAKYHIEFFTTKKMLVERIEYYKDQGIKAVAGKKSEKYM